MKHSGVELLDRLPTSVRRRTTVRADHVAEVLVRAAALPPPERILVSTVIGAGVPAADLALVADTPPRTMQRRVQRLLRRLKSDRFAFALHHADRMPPVRRAVAQAILIQGLTQKQAAAHLRLSLHTVRKELERISGLHDLHSTSPKRMSSTPSIDQPVDDADPQTLDHDERWTSH